MNRLPYSQLVLELDKLFFGGSIENLQQAEARLQTIDSFLEATGWNWDTYLNHQDNQSESN